jgi:hypothetical protein
VITLTEKKSKKYKEDKKKKDELKIQAEMYEYIECLLKGRSDKFIAQFKISVSVAEKLDHQKEISQLISEGELNKELKAFIHATDRYIKAFRALRNITKTKIDDEFIKDDVIHADEKAFSNYLIDILEKTKKYCEASKAGLGTRAPSPFTQLEAILAQDYQNLVGGITVYEEGEFANILKAFHKCTCIKHYANRDVDNKYIDRIKKMANLHWKEQWRITPKIKIQ